MRGQELSVVKLEHSVGEEEEGNRAEEEDG